MPLTPPQVHVNVTDIQNHVASVVCTVDWGGYAFNSAFTYGIYYRKAGIDPNTNEPYPYQQVPGSGLTAENNSVFTVNLSGLDAETQYQVYAYASNTLGTTDTHSYPVTFTTIYDPPIFNLENIVITTTDGSITISGITVTAGADYTITKYGICFSEEPNPTIESESLDHDCGHSETTGPINPGETQSNIGATFVASTYSVNSNKQYYITAYAYSEQAVHTHNTYSEQRVCITLPLVATGECQGATTTTVNLTGFIGSPDPNHYITEYGVCYSADNADPTIEGNHKSVAVTAPNPSTTHFTISLNSTDNGIISGEYYWRAYVKNTDGNINYINYATTVNHEKFLTDYMITATTDPVDTGSVSISNNGYFYDGDQCTLTATPEESFENWTKASDQSWSSNENPLIITVNASDQYVAHFDQEYTYQIIANAGVGGSATGGGGFAYGATCTLEATPENGYRFVNWTMNNVEVSDESTYEFSVMESGTYTANFIQVFTITATSSDPDHGTATVSGGPTFDNGATCTLTAEAAQGYQFSKWTKDGGTEPVSTNANYTFTVNPTTAGDYVAHFALVYTVTVTANPTTGGTVSGAGTFASGATCTLEALPNTGYQFTKWKEGNTEVSTNPYIISDLDADHTLVAYFDLINYTITANTTSTAQGTVTVSGGTGPDNNVFNYDELCTLTAMPKNTYRFEKWVKVVGEEETEVSISPIYSFYVHESGTYKAYFKKEYMIAATVAPTDGGTITGTGLYDEGDDVTLTAAPNPGYFFVKWTENGNEVSTIPTYTISDLDANHTLVAHFGYVDYTIGVSCNPDYGTVSGGGSNLHYGETCTLMATAAEGYRFFNWTKVGETEPVSTQATCEVTVTGDATYVANFIQVFTITVTSEDPTHGSVTGGGTYDIGATCTLFAQPRSDYRFVNWTKNSDPSWSSTDNPLTINSINASDQYVAHFEEDNGGGGGGKSTPNLPREIYPSFGINPLFMEMSPLEQALWSSVADDSTRVAPKTREGDVPLKPKEDTVGCLVTYPEINFNDAMLNGGGIYVNINNAKVVFSDGEINRNHANESGGGVYIGEDAEMTMINQCEVKHNHVDAFVIDVNGSNDKGGGGIFLNGVLYVGDGTDAIHSMTVTDNWAGTGTYSYHPVDPALNNRNNVFLPNDPDPLPGKLVKVLYHAHIVGA